MFRDQNRQYSRWFYHISLSLLMLTLAVSAACTSMQQMPATFPHSHQRYDARISWQATRSGDVVQVIGVYRNDRFYYLTDVELTVCLLEDGNSCLSEKTRFFSQLALDESAPFRLELPVPPGRRPSRLKFSYSYRLAEPGMQSPPYFGSFIGEI